MATYIFKGQYESLFKEGYDKDHVTLTIRAHSENEAYKKAAIEAARWHMRIVLDEETNLYKIYEIKAKTKPKPKSKANKRKAPAIAGYPHTPPEYWELIRAIERNYRKDTGRLAVRLGTITSEEVRKTMLKHKLGFQCRYCLSKGGGKYCTENHSIYYRKVINAFYGSTSSHTNSYNDKCPICGNQMENSSLDHIIPISKGGLEFDPYNVQYACLSCNIRKGGINVDRANMRKTIRQAHRNALVLSEYIDGIKQRKLIFNSNSQ